ncbi:hypothetical protein AHAS_Ahas20G0151500 [Arachis hypogaea]
MRRINIPWFASKAIMKLLDCVHHLTYFMLSSEVADVDRELASNGKSPEKLKGAGSFLIKVFGVLAGNCNIGKRFYAYWSITCQLFKIYFKLGTVHLCCSVIRTPNLSLNQEYVILKYDLYAIVDPKSLLFMNEYNTIEYSGDTAANPVNYIAKMAQIQSFPRYEGISATIGPLQGHFTAGPPNLTYMRAALDAFDTVSLPI